MRSKAFGTLLKLRQHQLEREQWVLYQKQTEEIQCQQDVEDSSSSLRRLFQEKTDQNMAIHAAKKHFYMREASTAHDLCLRKHVLAQQATSKQMLITIESQQRKEMMQRLKEHALELERQEYDAKERRMLDDLAQNAFARVEREAL